MMHVFWREILAGREFKFWCTFLEGKFWRDNLNLCISHIYTQCIEVSEFLFSPYQVKVLPNKPGTAMAHMDNPVGAKNAIHHLHGHKLLGSLLELK